MESFYLDPAVGVDRIPLDLLLQFYDRRHAAFDPLGKSLAKVLFERRGDRKGLGLLSAADSFAPDGRLEKESDVLFQLGTDSFERKDFATALTRWQHVVATATKKNIWPKDLFNVGLTFKARAQYDEAVAAFTRLRDTEVNDRETGAHIMEAYRNYRPRASWEIGLCRLYQGDAESALSAFRNTRDRFPF